MRPITLLFFLSLNLFVLLISLHARCFLGLFISLQNFDRSRLSWPVTLISMVLLMRCWDLWGRLIMMMLICSGSSRLGWGRAANFGSIDGWGGRTRVVMAVDYGVAVVFGYWWGCWWGCLRRDYDDLIQQYCCVGQYSDFHNRGDLVCSNNFACGTPISLALFALVRRQVDVCPRHQRGSFVVPLHRRFRWRKSHGGGGRSGAAPEGAVGHFSA